MTLALSRTRYVIKITNYLIIWVNKMQTEVALSITEADYIVLFQRKRDLIPLKNILNYLNNFIKVNNRKISTFSIIFKDNTRVLQLVNKSKYRLTNIIISISL